jgi:hypothetical protein
MSLDYSVTTLTADERLAECYRLVQIIMREDVDFTDFEAKFIDDMTLAVSCSPKQLQCLRRIKDKYL